MRIVVPRIVPFHCICYPPMQVLVLFGVLYRCACIYGESVFLSQKKKEAKRQEWQNNNNNSTNERTNKANGKHVYQQQKIILTIILNDINNYIFKGTAREKNKHKKKQRKKGTRKVLLDSIFQSSHQHKLVIWCLSDCTFPWSVQLKTRLAFEY